jgi:ABC-type glutathione transport system ATPase component
VRERLHPTGQLQLVFETLQLLGLYEIRHSQIGDERVRGISGGQRKRVNIGMELAADPTVLFLGAALPTRDPSVSMLRMHVRVEGLHDAPSFHAFSSSIAPLPPARRVARADEPTSGLDSSSSMEVCGALKRISELGLTIVAVIHQPRCVGVGRARPAFRRRCLPSVQLLGCVGRPHVARVGS